MDQVYELKELQAWLKQRLLSSTEPLEAEVITTWLLEYYLNIRRTDLLVNKVVTVPMKTQQELEAAIDRLNCQEPIQYVLGEAYFYGRRFNVSPDVLIPRRETEELVAWVKEENSTGGLRVLDIGTGSGCIAVTLGLEMNRPDMYALDISEAAIQVAVRNAALHHAKINFWTADLLQDGLTPPMPFDIIVSNPPYIRRDEASSMIPRVLEYEPDGALFVDNQQPLLFYKRMIRLCRKEGWLADKGKIYWEFNEAMSNEILQLLHENQLTEVRLRNDMQGKPRFVTGKLAE